MKDIRKQKDATPNKDKEISRREAMTKMGLTAFSVATMLLLLNKPENAYAQDSASNPDVPDTW